MKLQSKWILQVIARIVSAKQDQSETIGQLRAFLPEVSGGLADRILSRAVADVVSSLLSLIHTTNLEAVLPTITAQMSAGSIGVYFKPFLRVPGMTQFKRLMHSAHQVQAAHAVDQQMGSEVEAVNRAVSTLMKYVADTTQGGDGETLNFMTIAKGMQLAVETKTLAGKLPQSPVSQHFAVGQDGLKAVEKE